MSAERSGATGDGHEAPLNDRVEALRRILDAAVQTHSSSPIVPEEREALKQQIIGLFREADAAVMKAQGVKESVKALAEQWKPLNEAPPATPSATPPATPSASVASPPARVDHLGASTFLEKGWSKLSVNDAEGAEAAFRRALDLAPGSPDAQTLLAWAQMLQGRFDEARQLLQGVLAREPQHALAHTNLGYICLRTRMYGEAIEHLSNVVGADTDRRATMYAHLYLGMVHREREMYDYAEASFRRALELGPNLLQAWYELGRAYWFAGRHAEARQAWKTGSEANKFSPWSRYCAELLMQLEEGGEPPRE